MEVIQVYSLHWYTGGVETCDFGLWDNGSKIAVHWPTFLETFELPPSTRATAHFRSFYVTYKDYGMLETLPVLYYEPTFQDLVFTKSVWKGTNQSLVYTTIPKG